MKYIKQFAIILFIYYLGIILNKLLIPVIPSTVLGMLILFILLNFKLIKISSIKEFSEFLESFQPKDLQNLKDFFTDTARCEANIKAKCPKCKKTFETKQTGLLSFLI